MSVQLLDLSTQTKVDEDEAAIGVDEEVPRVRVTVAQARGVRTSLRQEGDGQGTRSRQRVWGTATCGRSPCLGAAPRRLELHLALAS